MEGLKGLVKNISERDRRTVEEIREQIKEAQMEGKTSIKFPISTVAYDRLSPRLISMGLDTKFINSSGSRSSYMEIRFI